MPKDEKGHGSNPQGYKRFSGDQVARVVQKANKGISFKEAHQRLGLDSGGDYALVHDYPVHGLRGEQEVDEAAVQKMAAMHPDHFPPIALDGDGRIRDGFHRAAAARLRGDKVIKAFTPIDSTNDQPYIYGRENG